jgi:hypothetical protein
VPRAAFGSAKGFAKNRDILREIGFVYDAIGPDCGHDLFFREYASRVLDENEQRLDALARKLDRCTVPEQNLGHRIQRKNAELEEYALFQQLSLDQNVT